ncbi:MAG TPA: hypothetical protein VFM38_15800 [Candidatus Limnocylindrales bacterium]|nr:hypothetical protein [Candidatus Limnocylindrales bacterium]
MLVRVAFGSLLVLLAGCSPATLASSSPSVSVTPVQRATATALPTPSASQSAADSGPPPAQLAAEGGDPTSGQLGTYVWHGEGSDSPWLPGAPTAVGRGEPLSVTFASPVDIASWRARTVAAGADGPEDATTLADGTGTPAFDAPSPGAWTLEVHVVFADDAGDASYFWLLDVR